MRILSRLLALFTFALFVSAPAAAVPSELQTRLESLAQRGSAEASYHLGMIYHLGLEGEARDYRRALGHFRRAAEGGDPLGAYKLGCYYAGQGDGVIPADAEQALRYKLVAAEPAMARPGELPKSTQGVIACARTLVEGPAVRVMGKRFMRSPGDAGSPNADRPRAWLYCCDRSDVRPTGSPKCHGISERCNEGWPVCCEYRKRDERKRTRGGRTPAFRVAGTRTPISLTRPGSMPRATVCLPQSPMGPLRR